jgi:large subunit ribosomal protein L35
MPKNRSHSAATKRLRVTGGGKIVHKRSNFRHILEKKTSKRKRRLGRIKGVAAVDVPRARRLLGG